MNKKFRDEVKHQGKSYLVDTQDTFDSGWETMVFQIGRNGNVKYNKPVYTERYKNALQAGYGHRNIVRNLVDYISIS